MSSTSAPPTWQNRIVGSGEEAPDQLLANPRNFRVHPKFQQDALNGALNEIGWIQQVIVNQRTGHVIDGHLRVSLAISRQEPAVPVLYVDLSEDEEKLALATFDPVTALAGTDREQLAALLEEVNSDEAGLQAMLDQLAQDAGIVPPVDPLSEWQGMPAFEHEDLTAYQSIHVHFPNAEAVASFAALIGQAITPATKSLWHPKQETIRYGEAHES